MDKKKNIFKFLKKINIFKFLKKINIFKFLKKKYFLIFEKKFAGFNNTFQKWHKKNFSDLKNVNAKILKNNISYSSMLRISNWVKNRRFLFIILYL